MKPPEPRRVIAGINLPLRMPLSFTLLVLLLLDRIRPAEWIWAVVGMLVLLTWGLWLWDVFHRESVDLLSNRKD